MTKAVSLISSSFAKKTSTNEVESLFGCFLDKDDRIPRIDLLEKVLRISENSFIKYKVLNVIAIYRNLFELRETLFSAQKKMCDIIIDEVEASFIKFIQDKTFSSRVFNVGDIFRPMKRLAAMKSKGPVAELADAAYS